MPQITTQELTTGAVDGTGVFDQLMRAVKTHLEAEFARGSIRGPEYAEVYLGSLNLAMQTGLSFLLQQKKSGLEIELLEKQLELAQINLNKATIELAMLTASQAKIPAEIAQIEAQTLLVNQQRTNLVAEATNIPKQGVVLDAQAAMIDQQKLNLLADNLNTVAKTALTDQQKANAIIEGTVLVAQECKLRAEFDATVANTLKITAEKDLLIQKKVTETAQVLSTGVDADSVIGKQKALYTAQTNGFARDAEQKAAKIMIDTWSVRRTTDDATVADATNKLNDASVGRAVDKLLLGVGA